MNRNLRIFCVALTTLLSGASASADFEWKTDEKAGTADLIHDGKPVIRYMFAYDTSSDAKVHDTYKVFHHVFGPASGDGGPSFADYLAQGWLGLNGRQFTWNLPPGGLLPAAAERV